MSTCIIDLKEARDLMCTAVEGGIGYWLNEDSGEGCSDIVIEKSEKFGDDNADTDEWYYISVAFTYEGRRRKVSTADMIVYAPVFSKKYPHLPIDYRHDAIGADAMFQFCAFNGEVIFG